MAETITPNTTPPQPPVPGNVSALVSPDIVANVKASQQPQSFGDQLAKAAVAAGTNAALNSTIARLYKQKADLIKEGITLDINHQRKLNQLEKLHTPAKKVENGQVVDIPPQLSDEEYEAAVKAEDINYAAAKENLAKRKEENQKDIDDYLADPFAKQKEKRKKRKEARNKAKQRTREEKQASRKQRRKAVLQNAKKTLVPILTLLLTNRIAEVISQNNKIQQLVDEANIIIEAANVSNNPLQLENAKIVRNNAITVIQSNEQKIIRINEQIQRITIYITIFSTIFSILSSIPIPTSVPPGIGIPVNAITKIVILLEKANKIVLALSALLPTVIVSLEKAIQILEELKTQLLPINGELESKLPPVPVRFGTDYPPYKGFKFALREENNPRFVVRGNKRHYAVAINKQNIEQLKSEPSFTLDPNDLIEQLKLVIDQQNLQG
jgi:hypothetical protein